jgi:hypothetical protein
MDAPESKSARILQIATLTINHGELRRFQANIAKAVAFSKAHGPQLLVDVFIDERFMRAHSCQIQSDSQPALQHWALADPFIDDVMRSCTLQRLDFYGERTASVEARMHEAERLGSIVAMTPRFEGYQRFV